MKITVIGTGKIGTTLGSAFAGAGHDVTFGSRPDVGAALVGAQVVVLAASPRRRRLRHNGSAHRRSAREAHFVTSEATNHDAQYLRCGCCGREKAADRLTELDSSPGVHICLGCALSAARRVSRLPIPRLNPRELLHRLHHLLPGPLGHSHAHQGVATYTTAIPIFPVTDLNRSVSYYRQLGFQVVERLDDYAVLASGDIELHLNQATDRTADEAFMHVTGDPTTLWTRLRDANVPGLGPVQDQPWGLREFTATDPDGNTLRVGHPSPG